MPEHTHRTYSFGRFTLDIDRGALTGNDEDIKLRPKSFQVLQYLVERHGRLVSKNDILDAVWGSTVVTDDAVTQCLIDVRRSLGDQSQTLIRTIPRRGYIFDVPVTLHESVPGSHQAAAHTNPQSARLRRRSTILLLSLFGFAIAIWSLTERAPDALTGSTSAAQPGQYSVAVLPFLDLSPGQDLRYFAEGISEEILNLLAQVNGLHVISRTSSFSFERQALDIAAIKEKLDVTHVLEGSVRQDQDAIRITVQLVDTSNSSHVWSETYDRKLSDVFAIQGEIAAEVLKRLATSLNISLPRPRDKNFEAYRLYLQSVHMIDRLENSRNSEAEAIMRQSLELDPNFAPAWRELARILWRKIGNGPDFEDDIAETLGTLEKALELDPDDAATLAYMGWHIADFDGELVKGARMFERALSLDSSNEHVIRTATLFALAYGHPENGIVLGKFGISRNPLCYPCHAQLARAYLYAGRLSDAENTWRKVQSLFGRSGELGMVLLLKGQPQQALTVFSEGQTGKEERLFGRVIALYSLGRTEESASALTSYLEITADMPSWRLAMAYAWTENHDAAFEAIENIARQRQLVVNGRRVRLNLQEISIFTRHPVFQPIHGDPRWGQFLDRYGISAERLANVKFSVDILDRN